MYIYKSKIKTLLINFRPIALLNSIYKIRATITTNRSTPITNMLTDERKHAYKSNKSTIDVIYNIKRNLIKNNVMGKYYLAFQKPLIESIGKSNGTPYTRKGYPLDSSNK